MGGAPRTKLYSTRALLYVPYAGFSMSFHFMDPDIAVYGAVIGLKGSHRSQAR